jgi:hypothetical protein
MKVNLKPHDDEISWFIRNAYYGGALAKSEGSHPCSVCRMNALKAKPTKVRGHFHASEFNVCQLALYQAMKNGVSLTIRELETEASLYDGHKHEATVFDLLEKGGLDVSACANHPDYEKISTVQYEQEDQETGQKIVVDFRIISHMDGALVFKNRNFGLEIKAVKKYTWDKIKRTGEISDQWFGQIQWYTNTFNMPFYLIVKNRATSDIMSPILIKKNESFIQSRLLKLSEIILCLRGKHNPYGLIHKEENRSNASQCKFCRFYDDCWTNARPKFTQDEEEEIEFREEMKEAETKVTLAENEFELPE